MLQWGLAHKQCNTRLSLPHSFLTKQFFFLSQGLACDPGCCVQALRTPIGLIFAAHPWGSPTGQASTSALGLSAPAPWKPQQGRAPDPPCPVLPGHGPQHGSCDLPTVKARWGIRQRYLGSKRHHKSPRCQHRQAGCISSGSWSNVTFQMPEEAKGYVFVERGTFIPTQSTKTHGRQGGNLM